MSLTGVGLYDILEVLRSRFTVKVLADIAPSSPALEPIEPGDDVLVDIEDTGWWRERMRNRPGNLLAGYRHRENLTQAELAAKIGVPQSHISRMESGRMPITPDMARRLAPPSTWISPPGWTTTLRRTGSGHVARNDARNSMDGISKEQPCPAATS
jgi:DNA-binding XRE family transcriptional regulator